MELLENYLSRAHITKQAKKKPEPSRILCMYELQPGDEDVLRPLVYHNLLPGNNLLKQLVTVLNYWMDVPEDKLAAISEIGDNLYNMSLVIDDIQDGSVLRRATPAAYTVFGISNACNACMFHGLGVFDNILKLNHPQALRLYLNAYLDMLRGQGTELYWRDNAVCPTEKEYEQMVLNKSGGLLFLVGNHMQLFARNHVEVYRFLTCMALFLQIRNDYESLTNDAVFRNKGYCEDITEGKFGHPIMHAINSDPETGKEILGILLSARIKMRTTDLKILQRCRSLIESCGSLEYTRKRLATFQAAVIEEVQKFEGNPLLTEYFTTVRIQPA